MARVLTAALARLEKKPAARTATLTAVRKRWRPPVLEKVLSAAGIIDVNER